jgi:hypothetical protein
MWLPKSTANPHFGVCARGGKWLGLRRSREGRVRCSGTAGGHVLDVLGEPFPERNTVVRFRVKDAIEKYNPSFIGYAWDPEYTHPIGTHRRRGN